MRNVLEYLENTAARIPDQTAVTDPSGSLSYGELLRRAQSVGTAVASAAMPRQSVIVRMEKSAAALAAMLGAVYAGCFYVYISPDQTPARTRQILEITNAPCMVTDRTDLPADCAFAGRVLDYHEAAGTPADEAALRIIRDGALDTDPLYCNFTSGSTGVPKGVLVCHRSVLDFIGVFPELFGITERDRIGNQAPFDFDVSVKDIYSALRVGAELVLIPRRMFSVVTELLDYLCERRVTTLIWAVSALCLVAQFRGLTYRVPEDVDKILFSGERMPVKYLQMWQESLPGASFVNLYGPTEITCNCTYYRIGRAFAPEEKIPIGKPFPNERVFLLDDADKLVTQPGRTGEICVAGTALALGYYNAWEQTQRVFVQNPVNPFYPERIYRTGDLASRNEDGDLCFEGRKDFQIKFMGHRIELEEIETALQARDDVERACCRFDEIKNRIIAYYCGSAEPRELKKSLYGVLPEYMIPGVFRKLDEMPLTANGKIDRKSLSAKDGVRA